MQKKSRNFFKSLSAASVSKLWPTLKFMELYKDTFSFRLFCIAPHDTDNHATRNNHNPLTRLIKYAFNQTCQLCSELLKQQHVTFHYLKLFKEFEETHRLIFTLIQDACFMQLLQQIALLILVTFLKVAGTPCPFLSMYKALNSTFYVMWMKQARSSPIK